MDWVSACFERTTRDSEEPGWFLFSHIVLPTEYARRLRAHRREPLLAESFIVTDGNRSVRAEMSLMFFQTLRGPGASNRASANRK